MSDKVEFSQIWIDLKKVGIEPLSCQFSLPLVQNENTSEVLKVQFSFLMNQCLSYYQTYFKWLESHPSKEEKLLIKDMKRCFKELKSGPPFYTRIPHFDVFWKETQIIHWKNLVAESRRFNSNLLEVLNIFEKNLPFVLTQIDSQISNLKKQDQAVYAIWIEHAESIRQWIGGLYEKSHKEFKGIILENKKISDDAWILIQAIALVPQKEVLRKWTLWSNQKRD